MVDAHLEELHAVVHEWIKIPYIHGDKSTFTLVNHVTQLRSQVAITVNKFVVSWIDPIVYVWQVDEDIS